MKCDLVYIYVFVCFISTKMYLTLGVINNLVSLFISTDHI